MELRGALTVTVDDVVTFTFTVTNPTDEPVELEFRDGLAADVHVLGDGQVVWRLSEGRMVTQALWSERLAPDETATYEAHWDDPSAGRYQAVATLEATNADVEARASFEV